MSALASLVRRFGRADNGNIAVMFAIALVPILGLIGLAVDFSRMSALKSKLQAAADLAALAVAKNVASNPAGAKQEATDYMRDAVKNIAGVTLGTVDANYTKPGGLSTVVVSASATIDTSFYSFLGASQAQTVKVTSTTNWGTNRLRVAVVLDTTGSMDERGSRDTKTKMDSLKIATIDLLSQLKSIALNPGDVYVSIIPFSRDVNIGSSNYDKPWIDWTAWDSANRTCSGWNQWGQCNAWTPNNHNTWNGCIADRGSSTGPVTVPGQTQAGQAYDQRIDPASTTDADVASKYPADQYSSCPKAMLGLTDIRTLNLDNLRDTSGDVDLNKLKNSSDTVVKLISSLTANGNTNQPIGLVWGWQSLAGGTGPFAAAPTYDPDYQYVPVIILLSDGLNTQNRWTSTASRIDARMSDSSNGSGTCANIKAYRLQTGHPTALIYTVQVDTGGKDGRSDLLKRCASGESSFFYVQNGSDIGDVFTAIVTKISALRVAK